MKRLLKYILPALLLTSLFWAGCSPEYRPNLVSTPLMQEKGETQVGLYAGTNGFDLQGVYSFHDHFAVMANGSYFKGETGTYQSTTYYNRHAFLEIAPGFFTPLGRFGSFEFYSGYGYGDSQSWHTGSTTREKGYYHRFFLQPNIGFTSDIADVGLGIRTTFLDYQALSGQSNTNTEGISPLLEPGLNVRLGYKYVKLSVNTGLTIPLSEVVYDTQPFMIGVGVLVTIPQGTFKPKE